MAEQRALVSINGVIQQTPTGDTIYGGGDTSSAVILLPTTSARNVIQPSGATVIPWTVKGFAAQSANLTEWLNSSGTVLANIDASGYITSARVRAGSNFGTSSAPLQTGLYDTDSASNAMEMFNTANSSAANTGIAFRPGQGMHYIAAIRAFTNSISGAADNTLRFYSAFDTTGAIDRTRLTEMMKIGYNYGTILTNNSAAVVALTVKGYSAQSANLQEWHNSADGVIGSISADCQTVAFGNASSGTTTITTKATNPGMSMTIQPATPSGGNPGSLNLKSGASAGANEGPGSINIIVPDKTTNGSWSNGEIYLKGCDNTVGSSGSQVTGGAIRLLAGYGVIGTAANAGMGGAISATAGAGGVCSNVSFAAGIGGASTLVAGAGGVHSGSTGGTGGIGGSIGITAGAGGAATGASGTRTGGVGGNITLTAGTGGTGATAAGAAGSISLNGSTQIITKATTTPSLIVKGIASHTANLEERQTSAGVVIGATDISGNLIVPKDSGVGIKVDTTTPTFGWKDLIGAVVVDTSGANAATLDTYRGGSVREYRFSATDKADFRFHMPHDWVPGTDLYIHVHWSHNGTAITGTGTFSCSLVHSYAKGYDQAAFSAEETITCADTNVTTANTPQYRHKITEVQLSGNGGTGSLLDTAILEVDGLILVNLTVDTIPTITGGATAEPFIHFVDIHYQSTQLATKARNGPAFYT